MILASICGLLRWFTATTIIITAYAAHAQSCSRMAEPFLPEDLNCQLLGKDVLQVVLQQCAVADLAGLAATAVIRCCAAATLSRSTVTAMPPTTLPACAALPSLPLLPFLRAKSWYRLWCGWSTASRPNRLCKVACTMYTLHPLTRQQGCRYGRSLHVRQHTADSLGCGTAVTRKE